MEKETQKIRPFPAQFWWMCLGALSFFLSFNIVLPELATELRKRGGDAYVSWIIPLFSMSALISRPLSGWITDNLGRKWAMIAGCVFCLVAGWFYPITTTVFTFLMVRVVHGFSTGFTPTGFTAYTADIVHPDYRGRAMGWQGMFNNIGTALGYALGAKIVLMWGSKMLFYASAGFAIASLLIFNQLPESRVIKERKKFQFKLSQLFFWKAWKPALLMMLVCVSLGSVLTVMPDFTLALGYENKGFYLSIYIATSLFFRLISGRISDALGRSWSTAIGTFFQIISMLILMGLSLELYNHRQIGAAMMDSHKLNIWFWASAVGYGLGQGFNAPSLFAWASDTAGEEQRGRALAMLFMSLELGIIIGGFMVGHCIISPELGNGLPAGTRVISSVEIHEKLQPSWDYFRIFGFNLIAFVGAFAFSVWQIIYRPKN